jgi:outer membrane murein-binding lipoprotein Lpp
MKRLRVLAAVALGCALLAGCSSSGSTPAASPTTPALPSGGEAEAFCGSVESLLTDLQQMAQGKGDAAMMGNLQEQAQTLAALAAKYETDLARDPQELQKVQDCLSDLSTLAN